MHGIDLPCTFTTASINATQKLDVNFTRQEFYMISDTEIWRDKVIRIETTFHIIEPIVKALLILCVIRSYL